MTETPPPDTESGIHVRMRAYEEALREASCEIEEKVREVSLLRRIADIAGHVYDIDLFYRFFIDMLLEETHAMNCSLLLLQENASRFVVKAARGRNDDGSL